MKTGIIYSAGVAYINERVVIRDGRPGRERELK